MVWAEVKENCARLPDKSRGKLQAAATTVQPLQPFSGKDAGDAGKIVGDTDVCPGWCVKERLDGREAIVAEFEDKDAAGFEMRGRLRNEMGVEFVALFAAVESDFRFVIAHFAHKSWCFVAADVGRVARDQIEKR